MHYSDLLNGEVHSTPTVHQRGLTYFLKYKYFLYSIIIDDNIIIDNVYSKRTYKS